MAVLDYCGCDVLPGQEDIKKEEKGIKEQQ
jgi:hypothetical protein